MHSKSMWVSLRTSPTVLLALTRTRRAFHAQKAAASGTLVKAEKVQKKFEVKGQNGLARMRGTRCVSLLEVSGMT